MPLDPQPGRLEQSLRSLLASLRRANRLSNDGVTAAPRLTNIESAVPKLIAEIGSRYLNSGALLEPLANTSDSLVGGCNRLLAMVAGKSGGKLVVDGTTAVLESPFEFLDSWVVRVQGHARDLVSSQEVFSRLQASESQLKLVVSPLTHIQTMFRIESARLPQDVRDVFADLTAQIAAVHNEVTSTFSGQFRIISQALLTLEDVRGKLQARADRMESDLCTRKRAMSGSVAKLKAELSRNDQRETELSGTSRAIAGAISNIVVALQSHDVCSQRLDDVRSCTARARELLTAGDATPRSGDNLAQAAYLLALQKAHVESVVQQLNETEEALGSAVVQIQSQVGNLNGGCILLARFEEVTVASHGSVELSLKLMNEAVSFLSNVVDLSRDFHESVAPVSQLTSSLTGALERLSSKMRLIALNAQVQAVHIGTGTGLEVLAAHTADVSGQTSRLADSVASDMQHLVSVVELLLASFDHASSAGAETLAALQSEGAAHGAHLHALRDESLAELQRVVEAVGTIRTATETLADQSSIRTGALKALDSLQHELSAAHEKIALLARPLTAIEAAAVDIGRYKMHSQRQVHAHVLQELTGDSQILDSAAEGADQNTDECMVELF